VRYDSVRKAIDRDLWAIPTLPDISLLVSERRPEAALLHFSSFLRCPDFPFVQAEVVRYLMPNGFVDQPLELWSCMGETFMRRLEDRDLIGHHKSIRDTATCQGPTLVQPEQIRTWSFLLNEDGNIIQSAPEAPRNLPQCALHHGVEFVGSHIYNCKR